MAWVKRKRGTWAHDCHVGSSRCLRFMHLLSASMLITMD